MTIFSFILMGGYIFMLNKLSKVQNKSSFNSFHQESPYIQENHQSTTSLEINTKGHIFHGSLKDKTTFSLTTPEGWEEKTGLNKVAELQIANISKGSLAIVIGERKSTFANSNLIKSLGDYSEFTRGRLVDAYQTHEIKNSSILKLGNNSALQYEIHVTSENGDGANHLFTVIETPEHYYQILISAPESGFEKNLPMFKSIVASFEEKSPVL